MGRDVGAGGGEEQKGERTKRERERENLTRSPFCQPVCN